MQRKILVTGADGFIGSHLVEHLVRQGHDVRAFVLYNSFNSWGWLDSCAPDVVGKFEVFAGDIRDPHGVRAAMQDCDVVLHLAALIGIPYSYHSPDTYVDTNIKGTLNVLQAGRDLGVEQIIHTSTSEVYGSAQFVPITEAASTRGTVPILRQQDWCRSDGPRLPPILRHARYDHSTFQYLRPSAVGAGGNPHSHNTVSSWRRPDSTGIGPPNPRL